MKITRRQLRKLITEVANEGFGIDTAMKTREVGNSSYGKARLDALDNGKAYYVDKNNDVNVFTRKDNREVEMTTPGITVNQALKADDGNIHYLGSL